LRQQRNGENRRLEAFEKERQFRNGGAVAAKSNDNKVNRVANGPLIGDAKPITPINMTEVLNAIGVTNKQQ
jgi:hypothetical protein